MPAPPRRGRSGRPAGRGRASSASTRRPVPRGAGAPAAAAAGPGRRPAGRRRRGSTPISFGGSGPERAKVKKTATITAPAARITRPEWASPPTIALARRPSRSQCSARRRAGRPCSPSRSRRSSRRRRSAPRRRGSPAIRSRAGRRGGRPGRSAWRRRRRRRSRAGWRATPIAADQRRLERDEQQQEAERQDDADHQRRLRRQRGFEVVVFGRGAADQGAGGKLGAQAIDRRRQLAGSRDRWWEPPRSGPGRRAPGRGGRDRAMPGSRRTAVTAWSAPPSAGGDDLEGARGARPEAGADLLVADAASESLGRHHLDRGHPRAQARAPAAPGPAGRRRARPPKRYGRRQSSSPQRAKRGERCSPLCAQGSASRSTRGPSLASTAGSRVSVAASTKRTETMIPRRRRAEGGARHQHHRRERDQHRQAREEDGLAGGVHRLADRLDGV